MDTVMAITTKRCAWGQNACASRSRSTLWGGVQLAGLLLLATHTALCQSQAGQMAAPTLSSTSGVNESSSNVLEPGDLITVNVFNTPELSGPLRVDPSGKLTLPVGGQIHVSGLSAAEASRAIERLLRDGQILLDPHVNILVTQFATQGVTILGEVRSPGIYPVRGSATLYDALSMAGGPSATEGAEITIAHRGEGEHPLVLQIKSSDYSPKQQITPILPGDTVVVSRAPVIYVVGDVKSPGLFPMPYGKPLSVLNLLALTQGFNSTAATKKASIVRVTSGTTAETIPLDLDKIMKNEAPNVELEASDVLVIPRSGSKTFWQYALPSLTNAAATGAISIALYK